MGEPFKGRLAAELKERLSDAWTSFGADYGAMERTILAHYTHDDIMTTQRMYDDRFKLPTLFKRGDRVQWRRGKKLLVATVSRYEPGLVIMDSVVGSDKTDRNIRKGVVHLRLDRPIETRPGEKRWAFDADPKDVEPLNAIMMLADLGK